MKSSASELIRNACFNLEGLNRSSCPSKAGILTLDRPLERLWFRRWTFLVPNANCMNIVITCFLSSLTKMNVFQLTVVCETKWSETKQNVVCEMTICSLRNDNLLSGCVYLDILNRKFPPKKLFRPENSDCAECVTFSLPRIKFNLSSGVSNRKQDLFPFYMPWRHHICIDKCHYSYRDDLPENLPKNAKSPLLVESTYSDIPLLKCILNYL